MSSRFSNPDWWPTPPPKPLKAPSVAKLVFGTLVPALAVVGAVVGISTFGSSGHKTKTTAAEPIALGIGSARDDRRQALQECMKNMGASTGARGGGRFGGGGPSKSFRDAFDVCRSLVETGGAAPILPRRTGTTAAPVA